MERPKFDFCWEGRLVLTIFLFTILIVFTVLKLWASWPRRYDRWSPRWMANVCTIIVALLATVYTVVVIWNYNFVLRARVIYNHDPEEARPWLEEKENMISEWKFSIALRITLVAVLWLVKISFVVIYFEFSAELKRRTRFLLTFTGFTIGSTFFAIFVMIIVDLVRNDFHFTSESYKYPPLLIPITAYAGAGQIWRNRGNPTLLTSELIELIISVFNTITDILLVVLTYAIFGHLHVSKYNLRGAGLMLFLGSFTVSIACVRLGMLATGMNKLQVIIAFDTMTDMEAFIAGCAACLPGVRLLWREKRHSVRVAVRSESTVGFNKVGMEIVRSESAGSGNLEASNMWGGGQMEARGL
ncbi:hypothetical protein RUND412_001545 [Rhizina undulata]